MRSLRRRPRPTATRLDCQRRRNRRGHCGRAVFGRLPYGLHPVAIAGTHDGKGYWIATATGRVFALGDAIHRGDASSQRLSAPIAGMAITASGNGYWLVAATTAASSPLATRATTARLGRPAPQRPVVGMAASAHGYWLVVRDGGVFAFGDAAISRLARWPALERRGRGHLRDGGAAIDSWVPTVASSPSGGRRSSEVSPVSRTLLRRQLSRPRTAIGSRPLTARS